VEALLFGLYAPESSSKFGCYSDLHINSIDRETENMVPNTATCPKLSQLKEEMEHSEAYMNYLKTVREPLVEEAKSVFGFSASYNWKGVFDCVQSNLCHNHTLPSGLSQNLYNRIMTDHFESNKMLYNFVDRTSGFTYAQIAMGSFVADFLARIDLASSNQTLEKLAIYSAHDNTLEPLTMAYNVNNGDSPPYAVLMRIELLNGGSSDLIRAYYDNQPLLFPGCPSTTCDYKLFKKVSQQLIAASEQCNQLSHPIKEETPRRSLNRLRG